MHNNHTLTKRSELCATPLRKYHDHLVYRHRAASHPSHSPFQLPPLAPLAYHQNTQ